MGPVFELFATLGLNSDEFDKGLDDSSKKASGFGDKLKSGLATAAKVGGAAIAAASTAVVKLGKDAVAGYADYEQLTGGIETLFGTGGKSFEEYAETAKATARDIENSGIDWSKYADTAWMEGGGISGLFEEMQYNFDDLKTSADEVAEYLHFEYDLDIEDAQKAIEAYQKASNSEKIQKDYESLMAVQDTMMSNAAQAYKTAGMSANEYMEMAIQSGASMISSVGGDTAKAAEYMDLAIVDMSDNVNKMGTSMESVQNAYRGFSKSNFTMLDNLALGYGGTKEEMERLLADATELSGVEFDIDSYADIVQAIHVVQENLGITGTTAKEASETISGSVGSMKAAWQNLLVGMADPSADLSGLIGNVVQTAETAFGNILPVAEQAIMGVATFVEEVAPVIAEKLPGVVETVLPSVLNAATSLVTALVDALPTIMEVLIEQGPVIINTLLEKILEMLPEIVTLGLTLLTSLAMGIADNLDELVPTIVDVVLQIVETITDPETLGKLIDAAIAIIIALANGIIASLPDLLEKAPEIIANLVQALVDNVPKLVESAIAVIVALTEALLSPENIELLLKAALDIIVALANGIIALGGYLWDAAVSILEDFIGGIKERWQKFYDYVVEKGGLIAIIGEWLKSAADWGKDIINNFLDGIKQTWEDIKNWWKEIGGIKGIFQSSIDGAKTWGSDMISNFVGGIKEGWDSLKTGLSNLGQGIKDFIGFSEPKLGPLSDFHTYAPDMMELFAKGIRDNEHLITDQIEKSFDFGDTTIGTIGSIETAPIKSSYQSNRMTTPENALSSESLAEAIKAALSGAGVYMDGRKVGQLVTDFQNSRARVMGV